VEFDLETLRPTYKLIVGLPGRSNALAIAQRLGLDDAIVADARTMVATEDLVADDLLDEINRTREDIRRQHDEVEMLRDTLQDQRDDLQARLDKIEDERRDIIHAARRHAEDDLKEFQQEIKRLRRDLRTAGMPLETVKAVQEAAQKLMDWTQEPVEDAIERPIDDLDWIPRLGDNVYLETLNAEGIISEIDEKELVVQVGSLRVRAGYNEIKRRNRSQKREIKRGHVRQHESSDTPRPIVASPGLEIDLRGKRVEEAISQLDVYIDAAYTSGLPFSRIIHGKGTGALRKAVRDYVREHPLVSKVTEGHPNEGGSGVTVIHMVPTS
jgi:DNA mismatch repair protein MutS2